MDASGGDHTDNVFNIIVLVHRPIQDGVELEPQRKLNIRVALLHVPRYPTGYVTGCGILLTNTAWLYALLDL